MLQLIIDGKRAAFYPDASLSVKLKNSLIVEREEDVTYPFTLPLSANRHIFNFPDIINNNGFQRHYSATVMFGPYRMLVGEVVITDISDTEIELYVSTDNRSFWGKYSSQYLDEYDLGKETWSYNSFNTSLKEYKPYVCVQLYDPSFAEEGYYEHWYNRWDMVDVKLAGSLNGIKNNICPFLRLKEVLRLIFTTAGYRIQQNAMDDISRFEDILIIFRHTFKTSSVFKYNEVLPHITIKDFLDECKNKFGLAFFVNEADKSVKILSSIHLRSDKLIGLKILDGLQKTIDNELENKVYKFSDKSVSDQFVDAYQDKLSYLTGDENSENLDSVECISTIVGTQEKLEQFYPGMTDSSGEQVVLTVKYTLLSVKSTFENTEFRLAFYNGLVNRIQYTPGLDIDISKYLVPEAAPYSIRSGGGSLLWNDPESLYNVFHKARCETDFSMTIDLEVKPDILMLLNLQDMFIYNVVCRNQRFIVKEQEIELLPDRISSYKLTVIPV